jgi:pSer/pThr/pTyr-binding forkhead associated (FHA) protein
MNAVLLGKTREGQDDMARIPFEQQATIGRSADNTVVIEDPSISGKHARIVYDPKEKCYFLEDLESLNGTELDGTRVRDRERLGRLHVITLANSREFIFQDLATRAPRAQPTPGPPSPAPPEPQPDAPIPEVTPEAEEAQGTMVEEGGFKLPPSVAADDPGEGTRVEEGGFKLPPSVAADDPGEGTRVEEGGFKLPPSVAADDAGEGTRIEEGGFKLPSSVAGDDAGEGTRVEEGGFKLPSSVAGDDRARKKAKGDDDTGEIPRARLDTDPSGQIRVGFRLDIPDLQLSFTLGEGENLVGRAEDAAVRINVPDISRRHAVITITKNKVTVRDEGSSNKTFIDDREVGREPVELLAGDTLVFGDVKASLLRG